MPKSPTTEATAEAHQALERQILEQFEGFAVLNAAVKITRAGDGLSQSLKTDPEALELGQEVIVVLRTKVAAIDHRPVDRDDYSLGLTRVHTLETVSATVAGDLFADQLDELLKAQTDRNRRRREAEQGIRHLFDTTDDGDGDE